MAGLSYENRHTANLAHMHLQTMCATGLTEVQRRLSVLTPRPCINTHHSVARRERDSRERERERARENRALLERERDNRGPLQRERERRPWPARERERGREGRPCPCLPLKSRGVPPSDAAAAHGAHRASAVARGRYGGRRLIPPSCRGRAVLRLARAAGGWREDAHVPITPCRSCLLPGSHPYATVSYTHLTLPTTPYV